MEKCILKLLFSFYASDYEITKKNLSIFQQISEVDCKNIMIEIHLSVYYLRVVYRLYYSINVLNVTRK